MTLSFESIIAKGTREHVNDSDYLYLRGDVAYKLYIVIKGNVRLTAIDYDGNEHLIKNVKEKEYFGESEIFGTGIRSYNAYAEKNTELISLNKIILKDYIKNNPLFALNIIENLCLSIDANLNLICENLSLTAYERICKKIHEQGTLTESKYLRINQTRLSKDLSLSRQYVNKCISRMARAGLIEHKKQKIKILDSIKLKRQYLKQLEAA